MPSPAKILIFQAKPAVSELTLARSGAIGARVRADSKNAAMESVTVRLWDSSWKLMGALKSDAAGACRFEGVTPGSYMVSVDVPTGFEADQEKCEVLVGAGGMVEASFVLRASRAVRGRIVDGALGRPLSGVGVEVIGSDGRTKATGNTTESGDYEFLGLPQDAYRVKMKE